MSKFKFPIKKQFYAFVAVGATCSTLSCLFLWAGTKIFHWHYLAVTAVSFVILNYVGYALNRMLAFKETEVPWSLGLGRYYLIMALNIGLNLLLMASLVECFGLEPLIASLFLTAIFTVINYFSHKKWTFSTKKNSH